MVGGTVEAGVGLRRSLNGGREKFSKGSQEGLTVSPQSEFEVWCC